MIIDPYIFLVTIFTDRSSKSHLLCFKAIAMLVRGFLRLLLHCTKTFQEFLKTLTIICTESEADTRVDGTI